MIQANEVRMIDENKEQIGVKSLKEALSIAGDKGLDLVEIAPKAVPPLCRVMDYGKFLYELHKKQCAGIFFIQPGCKQCLCFK